MKTVTNFPTFIFLRLCLLLLSVLFYGKLSAQIPSLENQAISKYVKGGHKDLYGTSHAFIENVGQYGDVYPDYPEMGKILFAYEGFGIPVLFAEKGVIYLHRKLVGPTQLEIEKEERRKKKRKNEEDLEQLTVRDRSISMTWSLPSLNMEIVADGLLEGYHTYGLSSAKARAYSKITYKNIYDGIDVVYSFLDNDSLGYEYSITAKPFADLNKFKMVFGGQIKRLKCDEFGNLIIKSSSGVTYESAPKTFYNDELINLTSNLAEVKSSFNLNHNIVSFHFPDNYDKSKALVIDPFVSGTSNLTSPGTNVGKAKDVDFDYAGNVYVTGGGDGSVYKLAKYDANGLLQWTFSGVLTIPAWTFGTYYGGWVVEKNTGNVYLGQGFAPSGGHRIVRINTIGIYDNYISTANGSFLENWKMLWNCNSGSAQLMIAGGGTNSNINFGLIAPPSPVISSVNVTGIPYGTNGWAQDISDAIIDPSNNALYTIYGSLIGTPSLSNKIYKNNAPYSAASVAWNISSGYTTIQEIANRPYLLGPNIDNSSNVFAINSSYLFYWDGLNLKAFDKVTGATVGTPISIVGNTALMCGGIIADECNNIFVGFPNGVIKVYSFNGLVFNDAAKPDISIPGFSSAVYDLAYYEATKTLYASGNGFVASFDVSSYNCTFNAFTINVSSSCGTFAATATVSPVPPVGSTTTYSLYNGLTLIASNTTGVFTGLTPNVTYSIKATINLVCSGVVTTSTFVLSGPAITTSVTNSTCGNSDGSVTINAAGGVAPYTYSINGVTFQSSNIFSNLSSGFYTVTVKDANNCSNTQIINVINSNGPSVSFTKTDASCGANSGSITAVGTGGIAPLTYSINGVNFQTSNVFPGLGAGTYTLTVKDFTGCTSVISVSILNFTSVTVSAIPASTFCSSPNGTITVVATGGVAPLQYSINANAYQSSNIFTGLNSGTYTVTVQDANGCLTTTTAVIGNFPAPTLTATAVTASCGNANGSITANSTGGVPPLQWSINGVNFQASNVFTGLVAGAYTVTVKDANNCTNTTTITVTSSNAPVVSGVATASSCAANTGSITASGSGGAGTLSYSINAVNYQVSTLFSGLAPGSYILYVKDLAGCIGATFVVVPSSTPPIVTATVVATACGANTGSITANGSGGTGPYTYSINNGVSYQPSNVFTGLGIGSFAILIKDANGCTNSVTAVVNNVAGLSVSTTTISSACSVNSGSITATGTGGLAPLQYSINGVSYQLSNTFSALGGGNYTVYVKDANGCVVTTSVVIVSAQAPSVTAAVTGATCAGNNGIINATGTGGTAPLNYSINGVTYQSSGTFINVAPGTYTVYVKDAANCIGTTSVVVSTSGTGPGITTFTYKISDAYPCNTSLGSITNPKVNGATCGSCTYSLNFGAFIPNATQLFLNLNPGTYYLTAKDANGCTKTVAATIGLGVLSTASAVVTGTSCNSTTGSIALTGIGTKTPYHASISGMAGPWITFDPTYTFTGLAPGTYTLLMADDESFDIGPPIIPGGCITTQTIIVPSTNGPSITASQTGGTCSLSNGTISAVGTGGTGSLLYNINGSAYQSSSVFTGLAAGTYSVTVMDGAGCSNAINVTVANSGAATATAVSTPAPCGNANGTITLTTSGGTAPYQYSVNGIAFQSSNVFTGLPAGSYTVIIGDAGACITYKAVTVSSVAGPTVAAIPIAASCNNNNGALIVNGGGGTAPYTYSINGVNFQSSNQFNNLLAGYYSVVIKDANGCTNTTALAVGNLLAPAQTLSATAATCQSANGTITSTASAGTSPYQYSINGINYQVSNVFTALASGTYTVYVKDFNGCITTKNILVQSPNVPQSLTATITNASCGNSNGSLIAAATGGIAPLQYSVNGGPFQVATSFAGLIAGNYTLTVRDANLCTKVYNAVVANLAGPNIVSTNTTLSSCFANDGTISTVAAGGTGALTYSKNGVVFQAGSVFTNLAPGPYTITVKDSKNCLTTSSVVVGTVPGPTIAATNSHSICGDTIIVSQTGGLATYQYNVNLDPYQLSNQFPCKPAGTYIVRVIDANGCKDSIILEILGSPLPIELLSFTGHTLNENNVLEWNTAHESNNDYFTLERSENGSNFIAIGTIEGAGSCNIVKHYNYLDENPFTGINYYRLKQTDFDGTSSLSNIIALRNNENRDFGVLFNKADDHLIINCYNDGGQVYDVDLLDALGRKISNSKLDGNTKIINSSDLARGYYFVRVTSEKEFYKTKVLIY